MTSKVGQDKSGIYEVSYHFVPTIDERDAALEAGKTHTFIEEAGGSVISDDFPKLRSLAYEIAGQSGGVFGKAYFGWMKFELNSEKIGDIKKSLEANSNILRFMIVKTVRENTLYQPKYSKPKREDDDENLPEPLEVKEASEAEIDKSIEELVIT